MPTYTNTTKHASTATDPETKNGNARWDDSVEIWDSSTATWDAFQATTFTDTTKHISTFTNTSKH